MLAGLCLSSEEAWDALPPSLLELYFTREACQALQPKRKRQGFPDTSLGEVGRGALGRVGQPLDLGLGVLIPGAGAYSLLIFFLWGWGSNPCLISLCMLGKCFKTERQSQTLLYVNMDG